MLELGLIKIDTQKLYIAFKGKNNIMDIELKKTENSYKS